MMTIHHVCILTNNYMESIQFYTNVLGAVLIKENMNFHGREYNSWLQIGNVKIELQTPRKEEMTSNCCNAKTGPVHIAFMVDDTKKEYEAIVEKGYNNFIFKNGNALYEVMGEKLFKLMSPEGTIIEFRDTDIS